MPWTWTCSENFISIRQVILGEFWKTDPGNQLNLIFSRILKNYKTDCAEIFRMQSILNFRNILELICSTRSWYLENRCWKFDTRISALDGPNGSKKAQASQLSGLNMQVLKISPQSVQQFSRILFSEQITMFNYFF